MLPLTNQVCSLEDAQRLFELDLPQKSLFYWVLADEHWTLKYLTPVNTVQGLKVSAFTVAELGVFLTATPYNLPEWNEQYWGFPADTPLKDIYLFEVEARCRLLIYLIETKLIRVG